MSDITLDIPWWFAAVFLAAKFWPVTLAVAALIAICASFLPLGWRIVGWLIAAALAMTCVLALPTG